MLVKTPSKSKKAKSNKRKTSSRKKKNGRKRAHGKTTKNYGKKIKKGKKRFSVSRIQPWKIILSIIIAGTLGILYLKHVFATQELLAEVEQLEQQYEQIKRQHDRYRLQYDRMIGPKEIYDKAKAAGFIDGGPAEKVIEVEPVE